MELKRLPYLPIHFFYHPFSRTHKGIFWIVLILSIVAASLLAIIAENPYAWALVAKSLGEPVPSTTAVDTVREHYRSIDVLFNVFLQKISFSAGMIQPGPVPVYLFGLIQLIAWAVVMTSATLVKSRWSYLFFLLFALFIHFSGISQLLLGKESNWAFAIEFGLIMAYFVPGFLMQTNTWKLNTWFRLLIFSVLNAVIFGIPLFQSGWIVGFDISGNLFRYEFFILLAFLFFVGKDPGNLLILIATNHSDKRSRWPFWAIVSAFVLLFVLEFFWINEFFHLGILGEPSLSLRPVHLLILVGLLTAFTSQNQYHQVKKILDSNPAFTFLLMAWASICFSYIFLNVAVGDEVFLYAVDRLSAMFFLCVGVFHAFYVFFNHNRLLRQRIHLYYLLTQGREFGFAVIWLLALGLLVFLEGAERWKSANFFSHSYSLFIGDKAIMAGDADLAEKAYLLAKDQVGTSVKANYNLGGMYLGKTIQKGPSIKFYLESSQRFHFPYGDINAAQLLFAEGRRDSSLRVLSRSLEKNSQNIQLANNLGLLYLDAGNPDSAIQTWKRALVEDPDQPVLLSNLSALYHSYGRKEEAKAFSEASVEGSEIPATVWSNYIAMGIFDQKKKEKVVPYQEFLGQDLMVSYHHQLMQPWTEDTSGRALLRRLANQDISPDAMLLDGWLMLHEDSMEVALSRLEYLAGTRSTHSAKANRLLGITYFERGLPEKAAIYFAKAGESGDPLGWYYEAVMNADMGWKNEASQKLSEYRVRDESLWEPCSKELAILLKAYGQDLYAQTEWDLAKLDFDEKMRIGIYADSLSQFIYALEAFRQVIDEYPDSTHPYLEMGRIYNRYSDPLAEENLGYGLEKDTSSFPIRLEIARSKMIQGALNESLALIEELKAEKDHDPAIIQLQSQLNLAQGDTMASVKELEDLFTRRPWDKKTILLLSEFYAETNSYDAGSYLIQRALAHNDQNPMIWYYYSLFAKGWGQEEEVQTGIDMAMELIPEGEMTRLVNQINQLSP